MSTRQEPENTAKSSGKLGSRTAEDAKADTNGQAPNGHDMFHAADPAGHAAELTALLADAPTEEPDQPGDEGHSPYAKRPAKLTEDGQYGSPEAATTVGGLYAAEHGKARAKFPEGKGGYDAVAALHSVQVSHADMAGVFLFVELAFRRGGVGVDHNLGPA